MLKRPIWLGTRQQLADVTVTQLRLTLSVLAFDSRATHLGVVLDIQLSVDSQMTAVSVSRVSKF